MHTNSRMCKAMMKEQKLKKILKKQKNCFTKATIATVSCDKRCQRPPVVIVIVLSSLHSNPSFEYVFFLYIFFVFFFFSRYGTYFSVVSTCVALDSRREILRTLFFCIFCSSPCNCRCNCCRCCRMAQKNVTGRQAPVRRGDHPEV